MSAPTNPLFEEEKAFLERKKLEYERALRGDVAQLKQQTADAGRVALVAGGLAGSVWLITKLFSSRKRRPVAAEHYDQHEPNDYYSTSFDDYDTDEPEHDYRYASNEHWADPDDYFGGGPETDEDEPHGAVYHTATNSYDTSTEGFSKGGYADDDDNGLPEYPDFPAHSGVGHGAETPGQAAEHFESEAYGHPDSTLPFDDSRRLPESNEFADSEPAAPNQHHEEAAPEAYDFVDQHPAHDFSQPLPKRNLGAMLLGLAKTDLGKVVVGQAASLALALVSKELKKRIGSDEVETTKSSDLAGSTDSTDGYAHGHPATPQPDAHHPSADAQSF